MVVIFKLSCTVMVRAFFHLLLEQLVLLVVQLEQLWHNIFHLRTMQQISLQRSNKCFISFSQYLFSLRILLLEVNWFFKHIHLLGRKPRNTCYNGWNGIRNVHCSNYKGESCAHLDVFSLSYCIPYIWYLSTIQYHFLNQSFLLFPSYKYIHILGCNDLKPYLL